MEAKFVMFSAQHWLSLLWVILLGIIIIAIPKYSQSERIDKGMRLLISFIQYFLLITLRVVRISDGSFSMQESLPLHLCGFSAFLIPLMLFKNNEKLFQVLYFWGVGGATQSLLTPTLQNPFPSFYYFEFFLTHGIIITGALYMVFIENYRPSFKGLIRAYWLTCLMLIPIGLINWLLGSNYFFIAHKPETASLLDFMGPWPLYMVPLSGVAFVIFFIVYSPFLVAELAGRNR